MRAAASGWWSGRFADACSKSELRTRIVFSVRIQPLQQADWCGASRRQPSVAAHRPVFICVAPSAAKVMRSVGKRQNC